MKIKFIFVLFLAITLIFCCFSCKKETGVSGADSVLYNIKSNYRSVDNLKVESKITLELRNTRKNKSKSYKMTSNLLFSRPSMWLYEVGPGPFACAILSDGEKTRVYSAISKRELIYPVVEKFGRDFKGCRPVMFFALLSSVNNQVLMLDGERSLKTPLSVEIEPGQGIVNKVKCRVMKLEYPTGITQEIYYSPDDYFIRKNVVYFPPDAARDILWPEFYTEAEKSDEGKEIASWLKDLKITLTEEVKQIDTVANLPESAFVYNPPAGTKIEKGIVEIKGDNGNEPPPGQKPPPDREGFCSPILPDFTLPGSEGSPVTLSQFRGRLVFICFWKPGVRGYWPDLVDLCNIVSEFPGTSTVILGVTRDNPDVAMKFAREKNISCPILFDSRGDITRKYLAEDDRIIHVGGPEGQDLGAFSGPVDRSAIEDKISRWAKK
ncbi:MAG: redoxin domain-containing protein [Candidatus Eremiobacteraeota bacterium]|nr:redoxin domain-containing protein [Candidatus Eremiobacteraeota bacterium]